MTSSYPFAADIRKYKLGGWESAKVSAKVNGKWFYFYNAESKELINAPELIKFEKKYKPPSDTIHSSAVTSRSISVYDDVDRTNPKEVRAPLKFKGIKKRKKFLCPVVYGSFYNHLQDPTARKKPNPPRKTATGYDPKRKTSKSRNNTDSLSDLTVSPSEMKSKTI